MIILVLLRLNFSFFIILKQFQNFKTLIILQISLIIITFDKKTFPYLYLEAFKKV